MTRIPAVDDLAVHAGLAALDPLVGVEVEHRLLRRPWGVQHVALAGPETAPPVVLVHGWPQHWLSWRHVVRQLSDRARVVCVDLRGFGWSDAVAVPRPSSVVAEHVEDLVVTLDDLHLDRAVIVGHDWGGWMAFRLMEAHPERVAGGAGLAIVPPWLDAWAVARNARNWSYTVPMAVAGPRIAADPAKVRWMVEVTTAVKDAWTTPDGEAAMASYLERIARPEARAMTQALYRGLLGWELRRSIVGPYSGRRGRLPVEATVLLGEHEAISKPEQWWKRTRAGELRLRRLPGVGHWMAEEAPDATAEVLAEVAGLPVPPLAAVAAAAELEGGAR